MSRLADNFRSPIGLALFLGTAITGVVLDLWTKTLAVSALRWQEPMRFIPGWLHFTYTENQGAVFGLGQGQRPLFLLVSVGAIAFLFYLYVFSANRRFQQIVLGMLMAGVIGNMYDRLLLGYVRDMIFALPGWRWPGTWRITLLNYPAGSERIVFPWIFNVADTLLCTGVFLMVVYSFANRPPTADSVEPEPDSARGQPQPTQQRP